MPYDDASWAGILDEATQRIGPRKLPHCPHRKHEAATLFVDQVQRASSRRGRLMMDPDTRRGEGVYGFFDTGTTDTKRVRQVARTAERQTFNPLTGRWS
jgi:hypothetical protein